MDEARPLDIKGFRLERRGPDPWVLVTDQAGCDPRWRPLDITRDDFGLDFDGDEMGRLMNAVRVEPGFEKKRQYELRDEVRSRIKRALLCPYLMCKPVEELGQNITVQVAVVDATGERKPETIRTAKKFLRRLDTHDCIRVTPRPEFPKGHTLTVETWPSMAGNAPLGAGALIHVSESDVMYALD